MTVTDLRQSTGQRGEDHALDHLRRRGFELVARNHRTRFGEIDLIVADAETLVFVEVKARRAAGRGHPWWNLGRAKQAQVRHMSAAYLAEVADRPRGLELRFDAIGVVVDDHGRLIRLEHLEGAF